MVKLAITPNSKSGFLGSSPSGGVTIVVWECGKVGELRLTVNQMPLAELVQIHPLPYSALAQMVRAFG